MGQIPMRHLLIRWAQNREKNLGYTISDRQVILGTHRWIAHSDNDIRVYIQLLDKELKRRN